MTSDFVERYYARLRQLEASHIGARLVHMNQCTSTNDLAHALAAEGAAEGTVVSTAYQLQGRGRMDRTWQSDRGANILASIVFRPQSRFESLYTSVIALGLAIAEAVEEAVPIRITVKWPNDLLVDRKKIAGILPESAIISERVDWLVVGMGINVRQSFIATDPLSSVATSIAMEGYDCHPPDLLALIMTKLSSILIHQNERELMMKWKNRMPMLGALIEVKQYQAVIKGIAEDITLLGELVITDDEGQQVKVSYGDATIVK